jgi:hypothetical protein
MARRLNSFRALQAKEGKTMRVHYVLNHEGTPASKLADVEIHFEDGAFRKGVDIFSSNTK